MHLLTITLGYLEQRFSPVLYKNKSSDSTKKYHACCALSSSDKKVSVWLTCVSKPLVILDKFDVKIVDLSWYDSFDML